MQRTQLFCNLVEWILMTVFVITPTFWKNIIYDLWPQFSKIVTIPDFDDCTFYENSGISLSIDISFVRIVHRCINYHFSTFGRWTINPWTAVDYRKWDVNMTVIIHHKGGYWNCAIRIIRILESLTAWGILLQTVVEIWVFHRACMLRW